MSSHALLVALLLSGLLSAVAVVDADGDGLASVEELGADTDALDVDTDDDALEDGEERARALDPLSPDTDADGLSDGTELTRGTDPADGDSDGDGLADGREAGAGTDPLVADTDGDGIADGREAARGTDPARDDTDGDGRPDSAELAAGTDPSAADSEGDGLDDGSEVALGTDPLARDSDGDGLADGREVDLDADPLAPDTDGDGFADGVEVHRADVLPGADPTRLDVYVEVDAVGDARLPPGEAQRVVDAFSAAPVGTNGSRGIHLHVVYNQTGLPERGPVSVEDRPGSETDVMAYADEHRHYRGYGYHYLLVVPEVLDVGESEVVGEAGDGVLLVQAVPLEGATGSTFMHELGHSLGLDRRDFDGVDSRQYEFSAYPSVMNYDAPPGYYEFSTGEPHDDWAAIVDDLYVPDADRLG